MVNSNNRKNVENIFRIVILIMYNYILLYISEIKQEFDSFAKLKHH